MTEAPRALLYKLISGLERKTRKRIKIPEVKLSKKAFPYARKLDRKLDMSRQSEFINLIHEY